MIKQGNVAFIKTTGEAVYVLNLFAEDLTAEVRRPVVGQNGVSHVTETFYLGELETLDDQRKRYASQNEELLKKYGPKDTPQTESFLA